MSEKPKKRLVSWREYAVNCGGIGTMIAVALAFGFGACSCSWRRQPPSATRSISFFGERSPCRSEWQRDAFRRTVESNDEQPRPLTKQKPFATIFWYREGLEP